MRVADVLLGLGRHEATRVFRRYVRDTIPPRPANGERIEVRGVLNPRRKV